MHRELNPNLFGSQGSTEKNQSTVDLPVTPMARGPQASTPYWPGEIKAVEAQVHSVKLQVQGLEKKIETLNSQMQEFVRSTSIRFERVSQALSRMEQQHSQNNQELAGQYAMLSSKVTERRVTDSKVQEMVDRHNNIVRSFENRLTHMQKVLEDQERQLLNSSAALDEARQEIARLKRL